MFGGDVGHLVVKVLGREFANAQLIDIEVFETCNSHLIHLTDYGVWMRSGLVLQVSGDFD